MHKSINPFAEAAANAVAAALSQDGSPIGAERFSVTEPPSPELGDFAVGCFPAAKLLQKPPPKLAALVAQRFTPTAELASAEAAGPFVNFRANRTALYTHFIAGAMSGDGLISKAPGSGQTVCIDFSSPNISKHLAYHHIRSTVIGHALCNMYRAVGYRVVGVNHLGDWGTTHGMLLAAYHTWGAPEPLTITALNDLYVRFRAAMKENPALEEEGRIWFKRLEDGDPEARALWQRFRDVSWAEFDEIYRALGIQFDEIRGESDYLKDVPGVLGLLEAKGLLAESEGALVVPPVSEDVPPMLLRKQDGATLYGTRDLAAAIYRWEQYQFARSLYVVDRGQGLHFQQLFATLARAGFDWAARMRHVPFGLVRVGGKKTGTRTGNVVLLKEVLAEAESRAESLVRQNNPGMSPDQVAKTARMVGIGAVVFANLAAQREKDVDFEWEQVLSTTGDSGPYIQYAHARCASILRRAQAEAAEQGRAVAPSASANVGLLTHELEWALARKLIEFGDVVVRATDSDEPHQVSRYLLDLCAVFSRWYTAGNQDRSVRVLVEDDAMSTARLSLVYVTMHVLRRGLALLGLQAPEVM